MSLDRIEVTERALRSLRTLPNSLVPRVRGAIEMLAMDPRPPASRPMKHRDAYRVEVGHHRIVYRFDSETLSILLVAPGRPRRAGRANPVADRVPTARPLNGRAKQTRSSHPARSSLANGPIRTKGGPRLASTDERQVTPDRSEEAVSADGQVAKMSRQEVLELVRMQLADILEMSPDKINESSSFTEDLNADSLALIELVESLEEELRRQVAGFRIDDEDLEDLRTVRDAVDYVTAKLEAA